MKNSILKGALNSFNAKKVATTKDFEVITSLILIVVICKVNVGVLIGKRRGIDR